MDGPRDYHTKRSTSDGKRQISYDITHMWNLKYGINEPIYKTETDSETQRSDLWLPVGMGGGRGMDWDLGVGR